MVALKSGKALYLKKDPVFGLVAVKADYQPARGKGTFDLFSRLKGKLVNGAGQEIKSSSDRLIAVKPKASYTGLKSEFFGELHSAYADYLKAGKKPVTSRKVDSVKLTYESDLYDFQPWGDTARENYLYARQNHLLPQIDEFFTEMFPDGMDEVALNDQFAFYFDELLESIGAEAPVESSRRSVRSSCRGIASRQVNSTRVYMDFSEYKPWGQAEEVYYHIDELGMLDDLDRLLEELYPEGIDETHLNDILAYDWEWVYESLGVPQDDDPDQRTAAGLSSARASCRSFRR